MNQKEDSGKIGFLGHIWRYFLSGVLVSAPLSLTIYLTWSFITSIDRTVKDMLPGRSWLEFYIPYDIPGIGLIIAFIVFCIIGATAAGYIGRMLVQTGEDYLKRMPIVRSLYSATKQIFEAIFKRNKSSFQGVVLLEYPRKGIWTLGLTTGSTEGEVPTKCADKMINVFIPTTPNPTSGFLLFVPENDVTHLHMTVEDGIKMIVSAGLITPPIPHGVSKEK
jgi:uncharacterized membrane protein